jgi:hypothetical protein
LDLLIQSEIGAMPDLGHRLRQLKWFRQSFRNSAEALSRRYGLVTHIDDEMLAGVFVDWVETLEEKKTFASVNRSDFIVFSGGLVLKGLLKARPAIVTVRPSPDNAALPDIVAFWPEGFLYANFCINAVSAVHQQEFGTPLPLSDSVTDLRTWWSFRENTQEIPAYAIAFLDRFFGVQPNWSMPEFPEGREGMKAAEPDALQQH